MLKEATKENLNQIKSLLQVLDKETYSSPVEILSGSSIGQHIRHILEFYLIFVNDIKTGLISYDKRERDLALETDLNKAISSIDFILNSLESINTEDTLNMESDFTSDSSDNEIISTSVGRELAYCIEHSIHHQAIIKSALILMDIDCKVDKDFGIAYSTIRYRKSECAQ